VFRYGPRRDKINRRSKPTASLAAATDTLPVGRIEDSRMFRISLFLTPVCFFAVFLAGGASSSPSNQVAGAEPLTAKELREYEAAVEMYRRQLQKFEEDPGITDVRVRDSYVAGDELRMIVELYRERRIGHRGVVDRRRGYVFLIDLKYHREKKKNSRLVGPLWEMDKPHSALALHAGVVFTDKDRKALAAIPTLFFNDSGDVLKKIRKPNRGELKRQEFAVERLDWKKDGHRWLKAGEGKYLPAGLRAGAWAMPDLSIRFDSREEFLAGTGKAGTKVHVYDSVTGRHVPDAWLDKTLEHARRLPAAQNVFPHYLTSDGNFFIVWPNSDRFGEDDGEPRHEFSINDKRYSRWKYGIVYSRKGDQIRPFKKPQDLNDGPWGDIPGHRRAFTLGGEPYVLEVSDNLCRLTALSGPASYQVRVIPAAERAQYGKRFPLSGIHHIQLDEQGERLIFVGHDISYPDDIRWAIIWHYKTAVVQQHVFSIIEKKTSIEKKPSIEKVAPVSSSRSRLTRRAGRAFRFRRK
jgi:hypothetical protein